MVVARPPHVICCHAVQAARVCLITVSEPCGWALPACDPSHTGQTPSGVRTAGQGWAEDRDCRAHRQWEGGCPLLTRVCQAHTPHTNSERCCENRYRHVCQCEDGPPRLFSLREEVGPCLHTRGASRVAFRPFGHASSRSAASASGCNAGTSWPRFDVCVCAAPRKNREFTLYTFKAVVAEHVSGRSCTCWCTSSPRTRQ